MERCASFHSRAGESEHKCLLPVLHKDACEIRCQEALGGRISSCQATHDTNPSKAELTSTLPASACAQKNVLEKYDLGPEARTLKSTSGFCTCQLCDPGNSVSLRLNFFFCQMEGQMMWPPCLARQMSLPHTDASRRAGCTQLLPLGRAPGCP